MKYSDWFRRNEAAQGRAPQSPDPATAALPGLERFVRVGIAAQEAVSQLTADKKHYVNSPPTTKGEPMEPATAIRPDEREATLPRTKRTRRRWTLPEKRRVLAQVAASPLTTVEFCKQAGISEGLIYGWRKQGVKPAASGDLGSGAKRSPGRTKGSTSTVTSQRERQFHVGQAFAPGSDPVEYAREHGISIPNLNRWRRQYGAPAAEGVLVEQRQDTQADALHSALEDMRLENTVLKAALQLAERRGFNLLAIGQTIARGGKRR